MTQTLGATTSWATTLEQQRQNVFYYHSAWLELITNLYGYTVIPLTTTNDAGEVSGYLPLCLMHSPLTGRRLVSLPFSDHCPILAESERDADNLVAQAIELAHQHKARYLELRTGGNDALAGRGDMIQGDLYVRWVMPLTNNPDTLWSQMRKPVQHQIKKSRKLGVEIRLAESPEDVLHYYQLHLQTRSKKHGMPTQPQRYFLDAWHAFASHNMMQILLAEHEGHTIAGMVLFAAGKTVRYAYGASDEQYLHLAPNNLLMWTAMTWGCSHGYQELDMGRTANDNEGLMEFKRRWGAIQTPLPYYYYPRIDGLAATSERSRKFRLLTACWRKLPLQVAGPLGGHLYRHLG
ncbi:MAG TPA: GNAT family N-acetyltransferase [Ktedonobacteraceae bacterium]|nr:GNAT family N-acetyltransferase [Ktedonobacteraceae bacterium]